jgi:hypothetical protein
LLIKKYEEGRERTQERWRQAWQYRLLLLDSMCSIIHTYMLYETYVASVLISDITQYVVLYWEDTYQ